MGNNKRILKNTLIMYLRMAILLILSLFTARIVFNTLGEINYGIYNLVGGIIIFFSFLNSGLSNATRRYVTAEIETGTDEALLVPIPPSFFQQESAIPSGYASEHESIAFFHENTS